MVVPGTNIKILFHLHSKLYALLYLHIIHVFVLQRHGIAMSSKEENYLQNKECTSDSSCYPNKNAFSQNNGCSRTHTLLRANTR